MTALPILDAGLTACCDAFKDAVDSDDNRTADTMSDAMDVLLDRRIHTKLEDGHVYPA